MVFTIVYDTTPEAIISEWNSIFRQTPEEDQTYEEMLEEELEYFDFYLTQIKDFLEDIVIKKRVFDKLIWYNTECPDCGENYFLRDETQECNCETCKTIARTFWKVRRSYLCDCTAEGYYPAEDHVCTV